MNKNKYEDALLGCLLVDNNLSNQVGEITPAYFTDIDNREVFAAISRLIEDKAPVDLTSVTAKLLEKRSRVGIDYLFELTQVTTTLHFKFYLNKVVSNYNRLKIKNMLRNLESKIDQEEEYSEILNQDIAEILKVNANKKFDTLVSLETIVSNNIDEQRKIIEEGYDPFIKTNFSSIDSLISGFKPGEVIILGGRPATGKTAFALNLGLRIGKKSKVPVVMYSLEMSDNELGYRIMAKLSGINSRFIQDGGQYKLDKNALYRIQEQAKDYNFYFEDNMNSSLENIKSSLIEAKAKYGIKMAIIDYLQLITINRFMNTNDRVAHISRELKLLANELKIPIIVLSQLSRDSEKAKREPAASDLRDSGGIEQDASTIFLLYYNDDNEKEAEKGPVQLKIAKCRNGSTGRVALYYDKTTSSFASLQKKDVRE